MARRKSEPQPELRRRAEAALGAEGAPAEALSVGAVKQLVHELQVHQVELEMQNDELQRTQAQLETQNAALVQTQVELEASRDRYFDLFDLAPVGYLAVAETGPILEANLAAATLLGETRSTLVGQPLTRFLFPGDQDLHYLNRKALFETGLPRSWETRLVQRASPTRWARLDVSVARDTAGVRTMRVAVTDVTEQRRADAALRRLGAAVEQTPASVVVTDAGGGIEYVNPAFEKASGYSSLEVLGRTPRVVKSGVQGEQLYRDLWATISGGKTWHGRLVNRAKDGHHYVEDTVIAPIRDGRGETTNYVSVTRDVTLELQLQQQLVESQKLESLGRLAGGIAHDFNNILAVILLDAEELPGASTVPEQVTLLSKEIQDAANRARDLTGQLLAFARKQVFLPVPVDLDAALQKSEVLLRRVLGEDIVLVTRLDSHAWPVRCDPTQLQQVIVNLAVNARDAMPRGGTLTLSTARLAPGAAAALAHAGLPSGEYVQLTVSDTGCGMTPEVVAQAFDPFFTTKARGKGTGLGLPTVHGIVKQSGGSVRCESEPGRGSTFFVCLPRAHEPAPRPSPSSVFKPRPRGSENILLVEDDAEVRRRTVRILEGAGYQVQVASDGLAALAIASRDDASLDLLVTDVIMPGLDGGALIERLKADRPELPALFVSGYSDDAISDHGVLREGVEFLAKPFTGAQLLARVRSILDSR
jgi:two-component system, cell cycle sensor histidine kinase and response regulator CckA